MASPKSRQQREVGAEGSASSRLKLKRLPSLENIPSALDSVSEEGDRDTDSGNLAITAYSDADWAGNPEDRRSTTGYCVFLGPNDLSWQSGDQPLTESLSNK